MQRVHITGYSCSIVLLSIIIITIDVLNINHSKIDCFAPVMQNSKIIILKVIYDACLDWNVSANSFIASPFT